MIYSESALAKRIFARFLPPYASRGGYFDGVSPDGLFPEGIYPIPVHLAPAASLDGIWIDSAHAPQSSRELASLLQTLGSGGIGVLFLEAKFWNHRSIREFCRGATLQLLFLSPVSSKGRTKLTESGIPIPRSVIRRVLLKFTTVFFPNLTSLFGKELFLIVQKIPVRHREADGMRLSVIVPALSRKGPDRIREWEEFISRHRIHEVELVSVDDDTSTVPAGSAVQVQHYRQSGLLASIRSGLLYSRGKSVLIDLDQRCSPAYLFDLMQARLQAKRKPDVIAGYDSAERPSWTRGLYHRFLTGFSVPAPLFLLLTGRGVQELVDLHPEQITGYPYGAGLILRSRTAFEEVELKIDPPLAERQPESPSLLSYINFRLRRGAIYLLFPIAALFLAPLPSVISSNVNAGIIFTTIEQRAAAPWMPFEWPNSLENSVTVVAKGLLYSQSAISQVRSASVALLSAYIPVELQRTLFHRFFFVLYIGQLIHLFNVIVVFRRPSGSLLPWVVAQLEALLILLGLLYSLDLFAEPVRLFVLLQKGSFLLEFMQVLLCIHLLFLAIYSIVYRKVRRIA